MTVNENLVASEVIDWRDPRVREFVNETTAGQEDPKEKVVALYSAVRDTIRYDPYRLELSVCGMKASATLKKGYGWCVSKAVLLAACCRAVGVPARLGFGDVKNHMSSKRLMARMGTDVFYWHGYTEILLADRWVKATPAFNRSLCEKLGIAVLEFDGERDSILQMHDRTGHRYMEYLRQRGSFDDLPLKEIRATFERHYPRILATEEADFASEAADYSQTIR
ncbi:MAG: transglutaminase-like domain-containing protein [Desulfopila sp.]